MNWTVLEDVGEFQKGGEMIRARLIDAGDDRRFLDIRAFYQTRDGEWKPTKRGIAVPEDLATDFDGLVGALVNAAADSRVVS